MAAKTDNRNLAKGLAREAAQMELGANVFARKANNHQAINALLVPVRKQQDAERLLQGVLLNPAQIQRL